MEGGKHKRFLVSYNFDSGFGHAVVSVDKPYAITPSLIDEISECCGNILHNSGYADKKAAILNIIPVEEDEADEPQNREFKVGDVIAYRTLEADKPDWVAWEVERIDAEYLYAKASTNNNMPDNIAKGSAFLVKAVEDKR